MSQVIAFDFGLARIGVAVGQNITGTASPLDTLKAKDGTPNWQLLGSLIKQWQPDKVLVGEPFNMDARSVLSADSATCVALTAFFSAAMSALMA